VNTATNYRIEALPLDGVLYIIQEAADPLGLDYSARCRGRSGTCHFSFGGVVRQKRYLDSQLVQDRPKAAEEKRLGPTFFVRRRWGKANCAYRTILAKRLRTLDDRH